MIKFEFRVVFKCKNKILRELYFIYIFEVYIYIYI